MKKHNTTLDQHTVATLKAYGGGTLSEGIRRAAELVRVVYGSREANKGERKTKTDAFEYISRACKCSRREKALGDGCKVCNPERANDLVTLPGDQLWSEAPENEELVGAIRRRNAKRRVEE